MSVDRQLKGLAVFICPEGSIAHVGREDLQIVEGKVFIRHHAMYLTEATYDDFMAGAQVEVDFKDNLH